jgi:hypothetical protein
MPTEELDSVAKQLPRAENTNPVAQSQVVLKTRNLCGSSSAIPEGVALDTPYG